MANIQNSISLTDRMTPTLRAVMKAMDSTLKAMKNLDKQSNRGVQSKAFKQAERDVQSASNAIIKLRNHSSLAAKEAESVADAWDRVDKTVNKANRGFGETIRTIASGIYTIKEGVQAISSVTKIADSATSDVAKLGLFNTSGSSNAQVYGQVYKTAQESRSDLSSTASLVQRILMSDAYKGKGAVKSAIDLSGVINKAMVLGGGSTEENNRAIVQLSQALSSGVLQGDELRSIREQAPYLAKVLAEGLGNIDKKYIGTTIGDLKELGAQGVLTSSTVIKALESMRGKINQTFDSSAPRTFSGALTSINNTIQFFVSLLNQADGPLGRLNEAVWRFANYLSTPEGFELLSGIIPVLNVVTGMFELLGGAIQFVGNNLNWLSPIFGTMLGLLFAYNTYLAVSKALVWAQGIQQGIAAVAAYAKAKADHAAALAAAEAGGAAAASASAFTADAMATSAATAAQHGFNAALWACPITWIIAGIILVIGLVFLIVGIINQVTDNTLSGLGIIIGGVAAFVSSLWNILMTFAVFVIKLVVLPIMNAWDLFANALGGIFDSPITAIIRTFESMALAIFGILETLAKGIDSIFGSNLAGTVQGWMSQVSANANDIIETHGGDTSKKSSATEKVNQILNEAQDFLLFDTPDVFKTGYDFGAGLQDKIGGFLSGDLMGGLSSLPTEVTGGNLDSVGSVNSDVNIADEDIQLLRDMAAREFLLNLKTVTPTANIKFGDVKETADVGKIVEVIEKMVEEQMATALVS